MAAVVAATPLLFACACVAAYTERGYMAVGGEVGVLALPVVVGMLVYGFEEEE